MSWRRSQSDWASFAALLTQQSAAQPGGGSPQPKLHLGGGYDKAAYRLQSCGDEAPALNRQPSPHLPPRGGCGRSESATGADVTLQGEQLSEHADREYSGIVPPVSQPAALPSARARAEQVHLHTPSCAQLVPSECEASRLRTQVRTLQEDIERLTRDGRERTANVPRCALICNTAAASAAPCTSADAVTSVFHRLIVPLPSHPLLVLCHKRTRRPSGIIPLLEHINCTNCKWPARLCNADAAPCFAMTSLLTYHVNTGERCKQGSCRGASRAWGTF